MTISDPSAPLIHRAARRLWRWVAKPGPVVTSGRLLHALVGAGITLAVYAWKGPLGLWREGLILTLIVGWTWERMTPILARWFGWKHPFADVLDLVAFGVGSTSCALLVEVVWRIGP